MNRSYPALLAMAVLLSAAPAQSQECDSSCGLGSGSFRTYGLLLHNANTGQEVDLLGAFGFMLPRGRDGRWMPRIDLVAGPSFYNGARPETGLITGIHIGLARALTGDYLELGPGYPIELYGMVGGAGYLGWHLEEAPEDAEFFPALSFAFGLRGRGNSATSRMIMIELLREERFGRWNPRLYLRITVTSPLGRAASPPAPAQP
ncbi:MAG TPA: hypothetical protein VF188_17925 [Longimicrobiales bacterium]